MPGPLSQPTIEPVDSHYLGEADSEKGDGGGVRVHQVDKVRSSLHKIIKKIISTLLFFRISDWSKHDF
jgi:hypothetical protein